MILFTTLIKPKKKLGYRARNKQTSIFLTQFTPNIKACRCLGYDRRLKATIYQFLVPYMNVTEFILMISKDKKNNYLSWKIEYKKDKFNKIKSFLKWHGLNSKQLTNRLIEE